MDGNIANAAIFNSNKITNSIQIWSRWQQCQHLFSSSSLSALKLMILLNIKCLSDTLFIFGICLRIVRCCWERCWSDFSNAALTATPVHHCGSEVINEMSESESTLRFLTATAGSVRKLCLTLISMPASFTLCSRSSSVWEKERERQRD